MSIVIVAVGCILLRVLQRFILKQAKVTDTSLYGLIDDGTVHGWMLVNWLLGSVCMVPGLWTFFLQEPDSEFFVYSKFALLVAGFWLLPFMRFNPGGKMFRVVLISLLDDARVIRLGDLLAAAFAAVILVSALDFSPWWILLVMVAWGVDRVITMRKMWPWYDLAPVYADRKAVYLLDVQTIIGHVGLIVSLAIGIVLFV